MVYSMWVRLFVASVSFVTALPSVLRAQEIVLGQSVVLSGPASELGREMRLGAQLYFDGVNAQGGIRGKKIVLRTLDDGYEADRAIANTKKLVADGDVHALFGYVGTPTSLPSIPIASSAKIPFFGAFTGAQGLREPFNRYVFNVRASYFDETEAIVRQMTQAGITKIAVFYQNDSYGQAGLAGVERALAKRNMKIHAKGTVERNTVAVTAAVDVMAAANPEAIVLISAYTSCAEFIKQAKAKGVRAQFINVSFVGTRALAKALGPDADGVMISQVMPPPTAKKYAIVREYLAVIEAAKAEPSYTSLEGYIAAKIMVEALRRGGDASREALVRSLESIRGLDLGGFVVSFGPDNHNASKYVDMTVLGRDGKIRY
jgi:branched-chain amino acid transport system substrate-binding protein